MGGERLRPDAVIPPGDTPEEAIARARRRQATTAFEVRYQLEHMSRAFGDLADAFAATAAPTWGTTPDTGRSTTDGRTRSRTEAGSAEGAPER